ncbi:MAG: EscU/YscU/HrcU family type III secretion system export apparatus switch protein, partial [Proteobacteria bacterium]|nr:EscU/YscU/HrcU family type III secretion system export apparatus switch protein [Pseudomonadota bacterium]
MAEDDDDTQKTEDPTAKRLSEARQQGNLPLSRDAATWMLLLGIVMAISFFLPVLIPRVTATLQAILSKAGEISVDPDSFAPVLGEIFGSLAMPLLALLFALSVMAIAGWMLQTGPFFNMGLLRLKWERLDPVQGAKRLFSVNSLFELVKGMGKILLVGVVAYALLKPAFLHMEGLAGLDNLGLVMTTHNLASRVFFAIFLVFTAIALVDLFYQRFTYFRQLRMTRSELREEFRQTEGDPHVKQRLKQIRNEKARKRMMAAVPKADVVITNPTHIAIAIVYSPEEGFAPKVVAKGADYLAERIKKVAREHGIPTVENKPLARTLYKHVKVG